MKLSAYLRSAIPAIGFVALIDMVCALVLLTSRMGTASTLLVCGIMAAGALALLVGDYARKRPFFDDLERCGSDIEHPLWLTELVERPDYLEGEIAYDALCAISKAANDDIAAHRHQVEDYREYIETWVHEAKSPLAAAHLTLDNLERDSDAPAMIESIASLREELHRVEGYIDQALYFARSEALERDYLIRRHSLGRLVSNAIKANASQLIGAHITPVCEGLDLDVFTDEKWIGFILGQIVQNSIKYRREGAGTITFSGRIDNPGQARESVILSIRDDGCGICAADLPRVFDKGFTGLNGREVKRSTGIGLYLVKRLCKKMDVGISAASKEGSWFEIALSFSTNKFKYFC
ncbi:integral membrane sensor signal transduction histidine kinase [Coriobacterium glomerans PW2]|uniref:Sensor-like histidine kinase SenX3 n=1 Tax=Coriobacterium glomerans (strain ATCC 49209 / DSM 20642 / JCM 10262 / PW2) TaxID=700015 RepID=F2NB91_CORGP|nr:sensor histidine kinase [Coriobacterium glomerans]AEB06627.1 integral membrane sensor signal transduction histidine kinase [Coriobacterium glomerans PW2]